MAFYRTPNNVPGYKKFWKDSTTRQGHTDNYLDSMNRRGWNSYQDMTEGQLDVVIDHHRKSLQRQGFNEKLPNAKAMSTAKKIGLGGVGIGAGIDTFMNMKQGDDFGTAALKGVATGMLWATMPGIMTAHLAATTAPGMINAANQYKRQKESWWYKQHLPNFGGQYQDTQRAQTMRQSAVQAIQGSKLNARSALGGEARLLSQGMYRG